MVRVRIVALMVLALMLAACTNSTTPSRTDQPIPAVDLLATPAGWVPVSFGDAQISVPEPSQPQHSQDSFVVDYGAEQYCSSVPVQGTLYVGSPLPESGCSRTVVALVPLPRSPELPEEQAYPRQRSSRVSRHGRWRGHHLVRAVALR